MATTAQSYNGGSAAIWVQTDDGAGNLIPIPGGGVSSSSHGVNSVPFTQTSVVVSTTSIQLLAAGTYKTVILCNVGATIAYINLAGAAATTNGVALLPNGSGSLILDNTTPSAAINAISTGAGTTIAVVSA